MTNSTLGEKVKAIATYGILALSIAGLYKSCTSWDAYVSARANDKVPPYSIKNPNREIREITSRNDWQSTNNIEEILNDGTIIIYIEAEGNDGKLERVVFYDKNRSPVRIIDGSQPDELKEYQKKYDGHAVKLKDAYKAPPPRREPFELHF